MAVWQCQACGNVVEGRCKPGKCKVCGATKDNLIKNEPGKEGKK